MQKMQLNQDACIELFPIFVPTNKNPGTTSNQEEEPDTQFFCKQNPKDASAAQSAPQAPIPVMDGRCFIIWNKTVTFVAIFLRPIQKLL
jgi:hypothetical protein